MNLAQSCSPGIPHRTRAVVDGFLQRTGKRLRTLPLLSRKCRCGRPLDPCGHHRVGYAQTGVYSQEHHGAHLQGGRWSMDVPTSKATVEDLKSSWTVCQSEVAHRLWWTPQCFSPCTERGPAEWRGTPDRPSEETEQLSRIFRTKTKGAIGGCFDRGRRSAV